jgi:hypothetical protein
MKPLREVIELLEHVRAHRAMYLDRVTPEAVENFVAGFVIACLVAEIPFSWGTWQSVVEQRGWHAPARRPATVMREHGLGEDAIVDELFGILIASVSLALATK